jgi:hypothetical protein
MIASSVGATGAVNQAQQDAAVQARHAAAERQAENAAGIGRMDQDEATSDRDADGRRLWERPPAGQANDEGEPNKAPPTNKDPTGQAGSQLDLSG